ncbi:hypothetical protein HaLaN_31344, partial [Haematococcus lacustris]
PVFGGNIRLKDHHGPPTSARSNHCSNEGTHQPAGVPGPDEGSPDRGVDDCAASEQQQPAQPPAHAPLLQQQGPATEKEIAEALMSVAHGAPKPRKAACPAAPNSAPRGPATHQTKKRGAPPKPPTKKPKVAAKAPARKRGRTPDTPPASDTSHASHSHATSDSHSTVPRAAGINE